MLGRCANRRVLLPCPYAQTSNQSFVPNDEREGIDALNRQ